MVIVFVKLKYILPEKISEYSDFVDLNLIVVTNKEVKAYIIILYLYKLNT